MQSIKGFATLKNVVNLEFASEVRSEVFEISLNKSWKKVWGQKCV